MPGEVPYFDRTPGPDGRFRSEADSAAEAYVLALVERRWKVKVGTWGAAYAPMDFYCVRGGKIVAFLEVKTSSYASTEYRQGPILNYRKFHVLWNNWLDTSIPGFVVYVFPDKVMYINVSDIDVKSIVLGGCHRIVKGPADVEPVIRVPIKSLKLLEVRET